MTELIGYSYEEYWLRKLVAVILAYLSIPLLGVLGGKLGRKYIHGSWVCAAACAVVSGGAGSHLVLVALFPSHPIRHPI